MISCQTEIEPNNSDALSLGSAATPEWLFIANTLIDVLPSLHHLSRLQYAYPALSLGHVVLVEPWKSKCNWGKHRGRLHRAQLRLGAFNYLWESTVRVGKSCGEKPLRSHSVFAMRGRINSLGIGQDEMGVGLYIDTHMCVSTSKCGLNVYMSPTERVRATFTELKECPNIVLS